ncbi:plasmid pRiA4b ORF-3 family protein, partial [Enterobacter hormaechei]|uniref:plasmid pRiA4b ORF-3 family protein n=1 Tax=Enterobacter hormaechei TaxID=158836 RepID=UPI001F3E285D
MKIYVIKIAVHGVSPMVWRRLRIAADTSLAALHFIFQIVQGWGDDHLHQFHIHRKAYGIPYSGGNGFVAVAYKKNRHHETEAANVSRSPLAKKK